MKVADLENSAWYVSRSRTTHDAPRDSELAQHIGRAMGREMLAAALHASHLHTKKLPVTINGQNNFGDGIVPKN